MNLHSKTANIRTPLSIIRNALSVFIVLVTLSAASFAAPYQAGKYRQGDGTVGSLQTFTDSGINGGLNKNSAGWQIVSVYFYNYNDETVSISGTGINSFTLAGHKGVTVPFNVYQNPLTPVKWVYFHWVIGGTTGGGTTGGSGGNGSGGNSGSGSSGGTTEKTGAAFSGSTSWQAVGNSIRITVGKIANQSSRVATGSLRVRVWATRSYFTGGAISGYVMGTMNLNPLAPGYSYNNPSVSTAYSRPPSGYYYSVVTIEEFTTSGWVVRSYTSSSQLQRF